MDYIICMYVYIFQKLISNSRETHCCSCFKHYCSKISCVLRTLCLVNCHVYINSMFPQSYFKK